MTAAPLQGEWRRGWGAVLAAAIGIAVSSAHYHIAGAMLVPLHEAYGWNRGAIAFALTIATLAAPVTNIVSGALADRHGPRVVVLVGIVLFGGSYSLLGLAGPALWTWYAAYALFALVGQAVNPVSWTLPVVRRFERTRGMALAVALCGTGVLVALVPSIVVALVAAVGVRGTFVVIGIGGAGLMLGPALAFVDDGIGAAQRPEASASMQQLREVVRDARFWRLALAIVCVANAVGLFVVHFQSLLIDAGMLAGKAARIALFLGPASIAGRLGTGFLFDRFPARRVAACAFAFPCLACVALLFQDGSVARAAVAAVLIGIGMGAEVDVIAYLVSRTFGLKGYGVVFGAQIGLYGLGVGIGSALAGHCFDVTGSYSLMLGVLVAATAVGVAMIATLGPPRR